MLAVIAKLNVKEGCEDQFESVMLDLAAKVNENEPGNHLYKLCKDSEGNYIVMEIYEDDRDRIKEAETRNLILNIE